MNGDQFRCLVINTNGRIPSLPAVLTVESFPLPGVGDQTVQVGQAATFSVTADFLPAPSFQWLCQPLGSSAWSQLTDSATFGGTKTSTLNVLYPVGQLNGDRFQCLACNAYGCITSAPAMLRVTGDFALMVSTLRANSTNGGLAVWDDSGTTVRFINPVGIAVDDSQNVYVANSLDQTIQIITSAGAVGKLAGLSLHAGDSDGSGTNARFNSLSGIAVDGAGTVYVADTMNHTIRKIASDGTVSTLAGRSLVSGSGDGLGTNAFFNRPKGVAVDGAGIVYVADTYNHTIRRVTPGGAVTTLAGIPGSAGSADGSGPNALFNSPGGIAVDQAGRIYVADTANNTIRAITPDGIVSSVAGRPPPALPGSLDQIGTNALFDHPSGVAVDSAGNVFVADRINSTVREISPTGAVSTPAGMAQAAGSLDGTGANALFNFPGGLAVDLSGNLYIADTSNNSIRKGIPYTGRPVITQQPLSQQTLPVNTNAYLQVSALGAQPLTYQWQKDGIDLQAAEYYGVNSPRLNVEIKSTASAGAYSVIVSNEFGVTTSQPALIRVPVRQELAPPAPLNNGLVRIAFRDTNGLVAPVAYASGQFSVQASTNLVRWQTIDGSFSSSNGFLMFTETPPTNQPPPPIPSRRFYRIRGE